MDAGDRLNTAREAYNNIKSAVDESRNLKGTLKNKILNSLETLYTLIRKDYEKISSDVPTKPSSHLNSSTLPCTLTESTSPISPLTSTPSRFSNINEILQSRSQHNHVNQKIEDILDNIKMLQKDMKTVTSGIEHIKEQNTAHGSYILEQQKTTYAKVAAIPKPTFNKHTLILNPTDKDIKSQDIINTIKEKINPINLGIGINQIKKINNEKILISCRNMYETEIMKNEIDKNIPKIETRISKPKNPLIVLTNVQKEVNPAEIKNIIVNQNKHILSPEMNEEKQNVHIRELYRKNTKNDNYKHIVIEVSPYLHKTILQQGSLYIGMQRIVTYDQSPLKQCSGCWKYVHTKRHCKNPDLICLHCGEKHHNRDCPNNEQTLKCVNCNNSHKANYYNCPIKIKYDRLARAQVAYLDNYNYNNDQ